MIGDDKLNNKKVINGRLHGRRRRNLLRMQTCNLNGTIVEYVRCPPPILHLVPPLIVALVFVEDNESGPNQVKEIYATAVCGQYIQKKGEL